MTIRGRLRRALHRGDRRRAPTGVFNVTDISGADASLLIQLYGVSPMVVSGVGSFIILKVIDMVMAARHRRGRREGSTSRLCTASRLHTQSR